MCAAVHGCDGVEYQTLVDNFPIVLANNKKHHRLRCARLSC